MQISADNPHPLAPLHSMEWIDLFTKIYFPRYCESHFPYIGGYDVSLRLFLQKNKQKRMNLYLIQ